LNEGLAIIINIHHFDAFTSEPDARANEFEALWRQIGEHYKAYPNKLAFELLNEPKDAATTEKMNTIYARVIPVIRRTNPDRTLFVAPGRWNSLDEVPKLRLPDSDRNLIVTVHSYEPFLFTHQGATWTGSATGTTGIVYPGPSWPPKKSGNSKRGPSKHEMVRSLQYSHYGPEPMRPKSVFGAHGKGRRMGAAASPPDSRRGIRCLSQSGPGFTRSVLSRYAANR
jgi:aryl-phospho-beta-D-glucosidase BglC (GH1 family)